MLMHVLGTGFLPVCLSVRPSPPVGAKQLTSERSKGQRSRSPGKSVPELPMQRG